MKQLNLKHYLIFTMDKNIIYNEDCLQTISRLPENSVDVILTSPPYNTSRSTSKSNKYSYRYDLYQDSLTNSEYIKWMINVFNGYNKILKKDGCILFNISYSSENTSLIWDLISQIQRETEFIVNDCIVWKKRMPYQIMLVAINLHVFANLFLFFAEIVNSQLSL